MVQQERPNGLSPAARFNAAAYDTVAAIEEYSSSTEFFPIEQALVTEFFTRDETVLDIGCGAGRTTASFARAGYSVIGVDLSRRLLGAAHAAYPTVKFQQADVRKLPFPDDYFRQVLFSFNGLDQVHPGADYLASLIEVCRVLKPGGIFIYSGHNILGRFGRHLRSVREFVAVGLRVHPRFLRLQLGGAQPLKWYWRYAEPFGELISFSAPPSVHQSLHRQAGFDTLAIRGPNNEKSLQWLTWREHHVHYVLMKR